VFVAASVSFGNRSSRPCDFIGLCNCILCPHIDRFLASLSLPVSTKAGFLRLPCLLRCIAHSPSLVRYHYIFSSFLLVFPWIPFLDADKTFCSFQHEQTEYFLYFCVSLYSYLCLEDVGGLLKFVGERVSVLFFFIL
jgi:hypothetical protein